MIQTGDPTGTGKGGQSIWGRPFPDEVRGTLKVRRILERSICSRDSVLTSRSCRNSLRMQFNQRGIVAMANSGPDSNKCACFLLFRSAEPN